MSKEKMVLDTFYAFQNALLSNNIEELDRLLAPDYRGYSIRGELEGRQAVLDAWGPGGVSMDESSYENLEVEIRGDVGIVTGNGFVAGTFQGEGWQHHLHFCDLYLKIGGGWQVFLSHSVEIEPGPGTSSTS
jgi:hypothetical protein